MGPRPPRAYENPRPILFPLPDQGEGEGGPLAKASADRHRAPAQPEQRFDRVEPGGLNRASMNVRKSNEKIAMRLENQPHRIT